MTVAKLSPEIVASVQTAAKKVYKTKTAMWEAARSHIDMFRWVNV